MLFLAPPNAKMRLHWWNYNQNFWLLCYGAQLKMAMHYNSKAKQKNFFFILRTRYFKYFIDFFSLFFLFIFFHLCSSISLIFSTLSFSCSFLFSKLSFFSNFSCKFIFLSSQILSLYSRFFYAVWGSILLLCGCGCGGSLASWPCCGYGESSVSSRAMGVGLCLGVRGSCRGVCVVGHQLCGHAVGVGCRGFYFLWLWVDFLR